MENKFKFSNQYYHVRLTGNLFLNKSKYLKVHEELLKLQRKADELMKFKIKLGPDDQLTGTYQVQLTIGFFVKRIESVLKLLILNKEKIDVDSAKICLYDKLFYRFKEKYYQEAEKRNLILFRIYYSPRERYFKKKRFQQYQKTPIIMNIRRKFEKLYHEFDFQDLKKGQNKQVIRIYDPENPKKYDLVTYRLKKISGNSNQ